ncbi:MAG: uracil-DNA glycosylase [Candidimonas sp.]|nr:MAG: uracil-DNA glycosylase [Candidimonas sp.]
MNEPSRPASPELSPLQIAGLQEIGLDRQFLARFAQNPPVAEIPAPAAPPSRPKTVAPRALRARDAAVVPAASKKPPLAVAPDWAALQTQVEQCTACSLCEHRRQAVFGSGAVQSPAWMVIGEAPGEQDDREGLPFRGRAGVLLNAMLAAVGLDPESEVFFTNLVKCRPMSNRIPTAAEINACLPYLRRQIALLNPRCIVVLGRLAAQFLLGQEAGLDALRGATHRFQSENGVDIPLVVTYHPASLLSRPQDKAHAWRDLNLARASVSAAATRAAAT